MGSHHDNHSTNEKKPVSFTVPFILAVVTLTVILLLVSLGDPCHHGKCECAENCSKECMEACEKGDHSKHPAAATEGHGEEAKAAEEHAAEAAVENKVEDTLATPTPEHSAEAPHGH